MKDPEDRPGFIVTPTFSQRARGWNQAARRRLTRGHDMARRWPFTAQVVKMLVATVVVVVLALVMPGGVLLRLVVVGWLAFMILQAVRIIQKIRTFEPSEGGYVEYAHGHGDAASGFTLESGILERDEVVAYDERPHWGYAVGQLFQVPSLAAVAAVVGSLLTPWLELPLVLVGLKVVAIAGGVYWIGHEEAEFLWTHYVVTNRYAHVLTRPPAIFGDERRFSLNLAKIETRNIHRPMLLRWMNMGHLAIDAPGQNDKRFNALQWVRRPYEFHGHLKPGSTEGPPRRSWRRR